MVRKTNCPNCGKPVSISSHWESATCGACHTVFSLTSDMFDISEEEQKRDIELAQKEIEAVEEKRKAQAKATRERLRRTLHLPEIDKYADVDFEDDTKSDDGSEEKPDKKKLVVLGGVIGGAVLLVIILVVIIGSALGRRGNTEAVSTEKQTTKQESVAENDIQENPAATTEEHDGTWVDGYAVDSNPDDGKYMIDLQSDDGQRDGNLAPAVTDEASDTDNDLSEDTADDISDESSESTGIRQLESSAASEEKSSVSSDSSKQTGSTGDADVIKMLQDGVDD